jgi:hypothetical protein
MKGAWLWTQVMHCMAYLSSFFRPSRLKNSVAQEHFRHLAYFTKNNSTFDKNKINQEQKGVMVPVLELSS